jgi:hypothetical protein
MAAIYVRSTDGANTDNGSTWALAVLDLHTATTGGLAKAGAGGVCYVSDNHAGSYAAAITYNIPGTLASPIKIIAGDDAAEPPTTVATATETTSGNGFNWTGGSGYWYGISWTSSYASTQSWSFSPYSTSNALEFESCAFDAGAGGGGGIALGHNAQSANDKGLTLTWRSCTLKLPAFTTATTTCYNIHFEWYGGSFVTNSILPTYLFTLTSASYQTIRVVGVDLSALSSKTLVSCATTVGHADVKFINCKLPATVTLCTRPTSMTQRIAMYGCDDDDAGVPHRFQITTMTGDIVNEPATGIIMTAGASDGTSILSWKMTTTADAEYPFMTLDSDDIVIWNDTTGSSKTATVEFLMDAGTTLYKGDVWMELTYYGTSGQAQASIDYDSKLASALTANTTECDTGSGVGSWSNETGGAKSYKLVSTFTPQEKGFLIARVRLAKASTTIYVDPRLTIA